MQDAGISEEGEERWWSVEIVVGVAEGGTHKEGDR